MRSTLFTICTLTALIGIVLADNFATAQDAAPNPTNGAKQTDESKANQKKKLMTMRPSPGVLVTVLRADQLKGVESKKPRVATVLEVTLDPMSGSPPHRHPGPVCGYVLEGTFEFQIEGKEKRVLKAGDTFYEPEMILHQIGRNPSSNKKTRVLATIIHPADAKQLVIPEPQDSQSGNAQQPGDAAAPAQDTSTSMRSETCVINLETRRKTFDEKLPTVGVILFNDVLMTEVTAPIDVFSKPRENGTKLFNVVTVAETLQPVATESGLRMLPDYTFTDCPKLAVLVVPSAYDMTETVRNGEIVRFIKKQNVSSEFTMSNCAGSQLIGESGIADGRKIVTYIGGGKDLKEKYPALKVQDDKTISFVEDGKFLSSNGNLASYISSLELLEKMSGTKHREFVESYLYLERLTGWDKSQSQPE